MIDTDHFTVERHDGRTSWERARSESIGGSEAAVIWGVSPYDTPASLWMTKTGRNSGFDDSDEWLEIGNALEEPIAQLAAKRTGRRVEDWGRYTVLRSRRWPWLTCTLDRVQIVDGAIFGPLEAKNRSAWNRTEDWSKGAPLHVQLQVQHQLAVTGWQHGSVAVLKGGAKLDVIDVDRDDELIAMHVEKCRLFWEDVRYDIAPPADGSEHLAMALRNAAMLARDEEVELGETAQQAADAVLELRANEEQVHKARREAENHLLMALAVGGVTRGRLPSGGLVTVKLIKRRAYVANVRETQYVRLDVKPPKVDQRVLDNNSTPLLEAAQEE
jgi:putative phage-type endonuclease